MLKPKLISKVFLFSLVLCFGLSACSLDANLESFARLPESITDQNRKDPDFTHGEIVTTSAGHQITGVFGEISETKKSFNNSQWEFEGVFYE